jgi:hypothetical protein
MMEPSSLPYVAIIKSILYSLLRHLLSGRVRHNPLCVKDDYNRISTEGIDRITIIFFSFFLDLFLLPPVLVFPRNSSQPSFEFPRRCRLYLGLSQSCPYRHPL